MHPIINFVETGTDYVRRCVACYMCYAYKNLGFTFYFLATGTCDLLMYIPSDKKNDKTFMLQMA